VKNNNKSITKANQKIEKLREAGAPLTRTIDEMLTDILLTESAADVVMRADTYKQSTKSYFCAKLIFDSIFEKDINLINQIAFRIDGAVPLQKEYEHTANYLGDAITDVLENCEANKIYVYPEDTAIVAMAKVVVHIALTTPGTSVQGKKDRQLAVDIILNRTQGKVTEPVKQKLDTKYSSPDWMKQLGASSKEEDPQGEL
jgi:hypothetical protein